MRNFGKMHWTPVTTPVVYMYQTEVDEKAGVPKVVMIPERTYVGHLTAADGTLWKDVDRGADGPDTWYIAVQDEDGFICCCEKDWSMIGVADREIWKIENPNRRDDIFCQRWDGEKVVPYEPDQS